MLPQQGYDVIGDVHGCAIALKMLLERLGYTKKRGVWQHKSRQAVFVGDIVDRGPRIRESLHIVHDMVDRAGAQIVMGNHEFNALSYFTPMPAHSGRSYLRERTARHTRIIQETLDQFANHPQDWQDFLAWFKAMPLFLELESFRVVHACWDQSLIDDYLKEYGHNQLTDEGLLQTMDRHALPGRMINRLMRGINLPLPDGIIMRAKDGYERHLFRADFWTKSPTYYQDVVFQPDPLPPEVATRKLPAEQKAKLCYYSSKEKPLFIGHYWRMGDPKPIKPNIACLDYSAVKYGKLVAYRFNGEQQLQAKNFVWVNVEQKAPFTTTLNF
ncbi:metallophosphoesterase [Endozoicomonas sp. SM1973]|uniref:Metallophosphoesterase n=1 Tax=Spartinivicinus marinus TaxID=2994442 RepID=A0A853I7E0_9GAMM|nr:metallophosphoesterase [Spartinivicinus marinus]MCX4024947.1 metallophosphoesterase [Spartinivicinus marinus]NYZ69233.1 metallophosphoesterase [Spartinivicinus marinus]